MVYTKYKVGYMIEYSIMKRLIKAGWLCYRTAGSKGIRSVDLIALLPLGKDLHVRLIQVKATTDEKLFNNPIRLLRKKEKEDLAYLCEKFRDFTNVSIELIAKLRHTTKLKYVDLKKIFI